VKKKLLQNLIMKKDKKRKGKNTGGAGKQRKHFKKGPWGAKRTHELRNTQGLNKGEGVEKKGKHIKRGK